MWEIFFTTVEGGQKGDKPGNHDETGSNKRVSNLEIMTKQKPVEGRRRETNLEIMTKRDQVEGGNHDETEISRRETKGDKSEGRQRETNLEIMTSSQRETQ